MALSANPSFYSTFKVAEKETQGKLIYKLGNSQWDIPELRKLLNEILPQKKVFNDYEVIHNFPSIGHKIMLLNARKIDHVKLILLAIEDITEQKKGEEKLKESEQRLSDMLESVSDGFVSYDREWRYVYVNEYASKLTGMKKEDLIGKSLFELHPDRVKTPIFQEYQKVMKKGKPRQLEYFSPGAKRWVRVNLYPSYQGLTAFFTDITDHKKAEEEIVKLAAIVKSSDDAIISQDTKGIIISWNKGAERLYGYSEKEVLGKPVSMLIPLNRKNEFPKMMKQILQGKGIEHFETERLTKEGRVIDVSITISPIKNKQGKIIGASKIAHDITDRKKLEQRKDDFIALASHELKTPVTSLKMFTQVLEQRFKKIGDSESAKYLGSMDKQLTKLTELVSSLLDLSRVQQGKLEYKKEKFEVDDLIKETVENIQRITHSHKIIADGQTKQKITGDRDRISQVLINLINNAIKYSPNAKDVIVKSEKKNGEVIISIIDKGMGIPESQREHIFERFFQVNNPTVKTYPGLGLGLYISKEIVTRHGGNIWVESKIRKGSTFSFSLPITEENNKL